MKIPAIIDLVAGVGVDSIRDDIASEIKESWALCSSIDPAGRLYRGDHADLDRVLRKCQLRLDARARGRTAFGNPGVPDFVHVVVRGGAREPDAG